MPLFFQGVDLFLGERSVPLFHRLQPFFVRLRRSFGFLLLVNSLVRLVANLRDQLLLPGFSFKPRSRRALVITEAELRLIASAAIMGDSNQPVNG